MKHTIFLFTVATLFLYSCYNGEKKPPCVNKALEKAFISELDSSYYNSHFGDILLVIPKDSNCNGQNLYHVIIAKIYNRYNGRIICRLLDKNNNWEGIKASSLFLKTKIIEYTVLSHSIDRLKIYTNDSTVLSTTKMPTFIVDAKLVEM